MLPLLPPELIEVVISEAWHLRLPLSDRILLMTSLPLVCRSVLAAYLRISSVNVYIPKPSYAKKFIHTLREDAAQRGIISPIAELCRTMTFEIARQLPLSEVQEPYALHWATEPLMGVALSDLLYDLRLFGDLPNFKTLTIRYIDLDLIDIFLWARFIDFPRTVEWLNLESLRTHVAAPVNTPGHLLLDSWRSCLPYIRHLCVSGGSEEIVSLLVAMMPNLDTVLHHK